MVVGNRVHVTEDMEGRRKQQHQGTDQILNSFSCSGNMDRLI